MLSRSEIEDFRGHKVSDRYFELFNKISDISSTEFPLVDFLNDIEWIEYMSIFGFSVCNMYDDIEKIYNYVVYKYSM